MLRNKPLAPSEEKRFMPSEKLAMMENDLNLIVQTIYQEHPHWVKEPIAQIKNLANFVLQLQLFMDEALGAKSKKENRFSVKIPAIFFRDYAHPNGVLKHILVWSIEFRLKEKGGTVGRRFELLSEKNYEFAKSLVLHLWKKLLEENFWTSPKIFIWGDPLEYHGIYDDLKELVTRVGGQISKEMKDSSHIILPIELIDKDDTETYFRALDYRNGSLFAHWWFYPDSYDCWTVAGSSNVSNLEDNAILIPEEGYWKLSYEYLTLLDYYNEWMNEGDFEIDDLPANFKEEYVKVCGIPEKKENERVSEASNNPEKAISSHSQPRTKRGRPRVSETPETSLTVPPKRMKTENQSAYVIYLQTDSSVSYRSQLKKCSINKYSEALEELMNNAAENTAFPISDIDSASKKISHKFLKHLTSHNGRKHYKKRGENVYFLKKPTAKSELMKPKTLVDDQSPTSFVVYKKKISELTKKLNYTEQALKTVLLFWTQAVTLLNSKVTQTPQNLAKTPLLEGFSSNKIDTCNLSSENTPETPSIKEDNKIENLPEWFSFDSIHQVEIDQIGASYLETEADKTQYMNVRNTIIDKYKNSSGNQITFSECRKFIQGDVVQLLKIYNLLEYWDIINAGKKSIDAKPNISNTILPLSDRQLKRSKITSSWTPEETTRLFIGISLYGDSWEQVAEYVGTKKVIDCFLYFLNWSPNEDLKAVSKLNEHL